MKRTYLSLAVIMLLALVASGCAKKPAQQAEAPSEEAPIQSTVPSQEVRGFRDQPVDESAAGATTAFGSEQTIPQLQRILFEYDQFTLSDEARNILSGNAAYLRANPSQRIVIEGHTDERGSDEYNLALGERRARAALNYLVSLGITADRLSVLSYGEERPVVTGGNENAWSQNRRAEFKGIR